MKLNIFASESGSGKSDYPYHFNGQENDDEIYGEGNSTSAEFWQYDTRLGRRWQIDPVIKYREAPYVCFSLNPIRVIDPKGDDGYVDKDGNYLGDDGSKDSHETRVIDKNKWDEIVGTQETITDEMRGKMQVAGQKLNEYKSGIIISDATWDKLEAQGGQQLQPFVQNDSKSSIFYKPEEGSEATEIKAGQDLYSPVDGIAAPHIRQKAVYKVVTGNRVTVTDSDINTTGTSGKASMGQVLIGGWHNESWLNYITASTVHTSLCGYVLGVFKVVYLETDQPQTQDLGWIELFKKAGVTDADKYRNKHTVNKEEVLSGGK